jgi:alkanesulfonate monooxygenase SsuD/methylene tetrahydromethanopterin reductase-like flavin-dependent oxidoreductase (luciferase family)
MIAVARDVYIGDSQAEVEDALLRRDTSHRRMIDAARPPIQSTNRSTGSHILAWADRPEARTEAALYGTTEQVAARLRALRAAGVDYVLCNIPGHCRSTLHRLIREAAPLSATP